MATAFDTENEDETINLDLPNDRTYRDSVDAELDSALVTAIKRAEDADHDFLAQLLRKELKSHFYSTRR